MKILIVEDEDSIREVIKKYLEKAGFTTLEAGSGEVAVLKFNNSIDLIILDLNLPNRDGIEVCKTIRKKSKVPIIMVTARDEETDELKGLAEGADDYIKKPFSPKVLVERVKLKLRWMKEASKAMGDLFVDEDKMIIRKGGQNVPLTTTQFKILRTLMKEPGKVFTRGDLIMTLDENNERKVILERTIDAHVKTIRKLVEDNPQNPKYIKTVIGTGYKFNDEI